jgi:hypothetical protein
MSKFYGAVGFVNLVETKPDMFEEQVSEKPYSGDLIRQSIRSVESTSTTNDNVVMNNQVSIIADPELTTLYPSIKYVRYKGTNWKVTSIDDSNYPRLILNLGEVYNGKTLETESDAP